MFSSRLSNHHEISFVCVFSIITAAIPHMVLVMCTAHVYSANILPGPCPKVEIVPHVCLELPGKEAYMPRSARGVVEIDWQLLSPVTTSCEDRIRAAVSIYPYLLGLLGLHIVNWWYKSILKHVVYRVLLWNLG